MLLYYHKVSICGNIVTMNPKLNDHAQLAKVLAKKGVMTSQELFALLGTITCRPAQMKPFECGACLTGGRRATFHLKRRSYLE